jgi:hypothetical protein
VNTAINSPYFLRDSYWQTNGHVMREKYGYRIETNLAIGSIDNDTVLPVLCGPPKIFTSEQISGSHGGYYVDTRQWDIGVRPPFIHSSIIITL